MGANRFDDILARMKGHQTKKRALYRALRVSRGLWKGNQRPSVPS